MEKVYARAHRDRRDKKMGRRRDVRRRSLCGCLWLAAFTIRAPLLLPCVRPSSFCCFFARFSHEVHMDTETSSPLARKRLSRFSYGKSFRLCDNWLPHRSRVAGRSLRPPSVQWETFLIIFHSVRLNYKLRLRLPSAATIVRFIISARKSLMNLISYFTTGK